MFSSKILFWNQNRKKEKLPWQLKKTMYKTWLSEVMLQQTQVNTVIPYYNKFLTKFPTITILAKSKLDEILHLWSGLGYYARAINLHKTAKIITTQYNGIFPEDINTLISLPGIGRSTAGAILSLTLNKRYPILDSNIKRILIRYYALTFDTQSTSKKNKILWTLSEKIIPKKEIADFNQSMMDLGRLICTNTNPKCNHCPIKQNCKSFLTLSTNQYPKHIYQPKLMKKTIWLLVLLKKNKTVWLEKRLKQKIWKELFCFPEFSNKETLDSWLLKYNLHKNQYQHVIALKHKVSNINLEIKSILININERFLCNIGYGVWYDLYNPLTIGLPKPVSIILKKI